MNALDTYLRETGRKAGDLARAAGISDQHLSKLRHGRIRPSLSVAFAIERATGGAVPASVWDGEAAA